MIKKWENKFKRNFPEFYNTFGKDIKNSPDLRPASAFLMKKEPWNPWERIYTELVAINIKKDEEVFDSSLVLFLQGNIDSLNSSHINEEDLHLHLVNFTIKYPVLWSILEKHSSRTRTSFVYCAQGKFEKLNLTDNLDYDSLFLVADPNKKFELFDLFDDKWSWSEHGNKTFRSRIYLNMKTLVDLKIMCQAYYPCDDEFDREVFIKVDTEYLLQCVDYIISSEQEDSKYIRALIDIDKIKKQSETTTFPYRRVVCMNMNEIAGAYKFISKNATIGDMECPIPSRPYVKVLENHKSILLDSKIKKSPITVEDILFSSKLLIPFGMIGSYNTFEIVGEDFTTIFLICDWKQI